MKEFIVWDKDDKQWLTTGNMPIIPIEEEIELKLEDNESTSFHQFIGKTDINGKKIYTDCSIIEFYLIQDNTTFHLKGFFFFDEIYLQYVIRSRLDDKFDNLFRLSQYDIRDIKIIGTLQQDKHLLGEEK